MLPPVIMHNAVSLDGIVDGFPSIYSNIMSWRPAGKKMPHCLAQIPFSMR
jgi:hypothetical protein